MRIWIRIYLIFISNLHSLCIVFTNMFRISDGFWNLKRLIIDSKTFVIQRSGCYKNSFISYKLFCDDIYNCKYKGRKNFPSKANIIILYLFHVASRGLFAYNCEFRLILCWQSLHLLNLCIFYSVQVKVSLCFMSVKDRTSILICKQLVSL